MFAFESIILFKFFVLDQYFFNSNPNLKKIHEPLRSFLFRSPRRITKGDIISVCSIEKFGIYLVKKVII